LSPLARDELLIGGGGGWERFFK